MKRDLTGHTVTTGALRRRDWLCAVAAGLAAGMLCFGFAGWRGFFCDEYLTWDAARLSVPQMIANRLAAGHSPLYFFLARLGLLLGHGETVMRLTSVAALFFSVLALAGLAGALGLRRHLVPILAVALVAPDWFTDGTTCRYMMLLVLVALWTMAAAARYADSWHPVRGVMLATALGLALWVHSTAQFLACALLVFLFWESMAERPGGIRWIKPAVRSWPIVIGLLASTPLLYLIRNHSSYLQREVVNPRDLLMNVLEVAFGEYKIWPKFLGFPAFPVLAAEFCVLAAGLWLARRALLSEGRERAWRLIWCLFAVIPGGMFLSALLVRNFQGPARYLTILSVPAIVALGVAWNAPVAARWRWAYRVGLVGVLLFQSSATVFSRGDRHREAIQFIIENHSGADPILAASMVVNRLALSFYGFKSTGDVFINYTGKKNCRLMARHYTSLLAATPLRRGFFIEYHGKFDVLGAVKILKRRKVIVDYRVWKPTDVVTVGAFIRDERDRGWLAGLAGPRMLPGPDRDLEK